MRDDSFTHFVTCPPERGSSERGFVKSLNLLIALAAGTVLAAISIYHIGQQDSDFARISSVLQRTNHKASFGEFLLFTCCESELCYYASTLNLIRTS